MILLTASADGNFEHGSVGVRDPRPRTVGSPPLQSEVPGNNETAEVAALAVSGSTVGINLTWLSPGVVGGTEEHAVQLLRGLATLADLDLDLRIYATKEFEKTYPDLCQRWTVKTMPWPSSSGSSVPRLISKAARVLFENSWLAAVSRSDAFVHHLGGSIPLVRSAPAVVTIHDLQPLDMPKNFSALKRLWLRWILPYSAHSAEQTLCPSQFTAGRIRDRLGVDVGAVRVVPYSCPDPTETNRGNERVAPPELIGADFSGLVAKNATTKLDFELDPFVLYPAIAYSHKRHIDIVEMLALLAPEHPTLSVVFTGRQGPETAAVTERAARLGVGDRVHFLGRVPTPQLDWLYEHALAVVFPSSYEGFGNPVLEAMARGCPVIVSDAGSLPEVVGDAGLVVEVGNIADYADAVGSLLERPRAARLLATKARRRFENANGGITAARTAAVYRDVLSSQR